MSDEIIIEMLNEFKEMLLEILNRLEPEEDIPVPVIDPNACQHVEIDDYGTDIHCPLPAIESGYCVNHIGDYKEFVGLVELYVKDRLKVATADEIKEANKKDRAWKSHLLEDLGITTAVMMRIIKQCESEKMEIGAIVNKILNEN